MATKVKVATLETRIILVREDQVAWLELVDFDGSIIVVLSARFNSMSALLFTNLASCARRRFYIGRTKLDTNVTDDTDPAKPLKVMEPQMPPASVPG